MQFALMIAGNSLSHAAKGIVLREALAARGHKATLIVARRAAEFLAARGVPHRVAPDIQESDFSPSPTPAWFKPRVLRTVIEAEARLLRELRPDGVLGVFRFTGPAAARLAGLPYDALVCGCMTPYCREPLGFGPADPERLAQEQLWRFFRGACAKSACLALASLGLPPIDDILELLRGRRTFLWDFPEFQPLAAALDVRHVGPIWLPLWPDEDFDQAGFLALPVPRAIITFGTARPAGGLLMSCARQLLDMGWSVAMGLGGQRVALPAHRRLIAFRFLPADRVLPHVSLVLCHGGQATIFEALRHRRPVLVAPTQPEQAQNGVCLERIGCGRRLLPPQLCSASPAGVLADPAALDRRVFQEAVAAMADGTVSAALDHAAQLVGRYDGAPTLADALEGGA